MLYRTKTSWKTSCCIFRKTTQLFGKTYLRQLSKTVLKNFSRHKVLVIGGASKYLPPSGSFIGSVLSYQPVIKDSIHNMLWLGAGGIKIDHLAWLLFIERDKRVTLVFWCNIYFPKKFLWSINFCQPWIFFFASSVPKRLLKFRAINLSAGVVHLLPFSGCVSK